MKKLLLLMLLSGTATCLMANIITVTKGEAVLDNIDGTLEWAIQVANSGDTIHFAIEGEGYGYKPAIVSKITIDKSLLIDGEEQGVVIEALFVYGDENSKLMFVNNAPETQIDIRLNNITFQQFNSNKKEQASIQVFTGVNVIFSNCAFPRFIGAVLSKEGASNVTLQDCDISDCSFYETGLINNSGGSGEGKLNVINTHFESNVTDDNGALINCLDSLTIIGSIFKNNKGKSVIECGTRKPLQISNSVIFNNTVSSNLVISKAGGTAVLTNTTVANNTGFAIYNLDGALSVRNSIFYGNTGGIVYNNSEFDILIKVQNSLVQGLAASNDNLDGNTNPLLDSNARPRDFRSPIVNRGNNDFVTDGTDVTGGKRIVQGIVDMGAYEIKSLLYVDSSVATSGNGYSWGQAYKTLEEAINNNDAEQQEIWVKKGTYKPNAYPLGCTSCMDTHDYAFTLPSGVKLYGSFSGNETSFEQRTLATMIVNPTILSGDLNGDDGAGFANNSDNAFHVLMSAGSSDSTVLDGFAITGGNATNFNLRRINGDEIHGDEGGGMYIMEGAPTVQNCVFVGNRATYGGGMFVKKSSPVITHVIASDNEALNWGGGIDIELKSTALLTNTTFARNKAAYGGGITISQECEAAIANLVMANNTAFSGGAMQIQNESHASVINATLYGNKATYGGGILNYSRAKLNLYNSIVYGNTSTYNDNPGIVNEGAAADEPNVIANSLVQGETNTNNGNISGNSDPLFVNPANPWGADGILGTDDDGLQLQLCSPAVNAGSVSYILSGLDQDIIGNDRIFGNTLDMGAYELQQSQSTLNLVTSNTSVSVFLSPRQTIDFVKDCELLATVKSSGQEAISDIVNATVWTDVSDLLFNDRPLAKRHFEITPKINPEDATGTVKLYMTQQEFDSYNIAATALNYLPLPYSADDNVGKANLRVLFFNGFSNNGTGTPDSYPAAMLEMTPADGNIVWNNNQQRWEISIDMKGFGGFFISTPKNLGSLPIRLLSFTGQLLNGKANLQWQTTGDENTSHFIVEKSIDGIHFSSIDKVASQGNGNHDYSFIDAQPVGNNYYRLITVDKDGKTAYSNIVLLTSHNSLFTLYPQPANSYVLLQASNLNLLNTPAVLIDLQGRQIKQMKINQLPFRLDINGLPAGIYHIKLYDGQVLKMIKN